MEDMGLSCRYNESKDRVGKEAKNQNKELKEVVLI